jgi:hypothetical protein
MIAITNRNYLTVGGTVVVDTLANVAIVLRASIDDVDCVVYCRNVNTYIVMQTVNITGCDIDVCNVDVVDVVAAVVVKIAVIDIGVVRIRQPALYSSRCSQRNAVLMHRGHVSFVYDNGSNHTGLRNFKPHNVRNSCFRDSAELVTHTKKTTRRC